MNERIQKLAEQAVQLVANEHTKGDVSRLNTDAYQVKDLIQEKFAELIVKECAENFAKVWYEQGLDIRGAELDKFLKPFEEHFGVEE